MDRHSDEPRYKVGDRVHAYMDHYFGGADIPSGEYTITAYLGHNRYEITDITDNKTKYEIIDTFIQGLQRDRSE